MHGTTMPITMEPIHPEPGEALMTDVLEPRGVSQRCAAVSIGVSPHRSNEIVHVRRRITADTALRSATHLGTNERSWIALKARCDLEVERDQQGPVLDAITPWALA